MPNFWLVLFDADGKPKGDETIFGSMIIYMGHDADFDPTDGLIKLGPLQAEHVTDPHCVSAVVDGREVGIGSSDIEFAVGDQFRRVGDDEFRQLFGEEAYQAELAKITEDDARLAKLADWHPPKMLDVNELPSVEVPEDATQELRDYVTEAVGFIFPETTLQAVMAIDTEHPGFATAWCARIKPELIQELHAMVNTSLTFQSDDLASLCEEVASHKHDDNFKMLAASNLRHMDYMVRLAKLLPPTDPVKDYGMFERDFDKFEKKLAEIFSQASAAD